MIGWLLVGLVVSGLLGIGTLAVVAPRSSAAQYGIVVDDPRALAFIRAMGMRDVVIGLLLGLLAASRSRALVAWGLYAATLIAILDFVVVTMDGRPVVERGVPARVLHAAGAIGLAIAGAVVHAGY